MAVRATNAEGKEVVNWLCRSKLTRSAKLGLGLGFTLSTRRGLRTVRPGHATSLPRVLSVPEAQGSVPHALYVLGTRTRPGRAGTYRAPWHPTAEICWLSPQAAVGKGLRRAALHPSGEVGLWTRWAARPNPKPTP